MFLIGFYPILQKPSLQDFKITKVIIFDKRNFLHPASLFQPLFIKELN